MNFCIFFLILSIVHVTLCSEYNGTGDDTCSLCTISWFRRKRAQTEYTRWRTNQDTTQEFIVKVFDDDITTARTQKVVAVNIQPLVKNEKKIVIGGALVPPLTTVTTLSDPIDYTRFMPPTTIPEGHKKSNEKIMIDEIPVITPRGVIKSEHRFTAKKKAAVKHADRDESPPSGPQFLGRSANSLARQYAPVAPVSFNRGITIAPVTPRSVERFMYKTPNRPTRTFPYADVIKPSRTKPKALFRNNFHIDSTFITDDQILVFRTSSSEINDYKKSFTPNFRRDESFDSFTEDNFIGLSKNNENFSKLDEREFKLSSKKDIIDNDVDKNIKAKNALEIDKDNDQYEMALNDLEHSKITNETLEDAEDSDNSTELDPRAYVDEQNNFENATLKPVPSRTTANQISTKEKPKTLYRKRKQICTMVKLRQLNFNSPRTLPEIVTQLKQWAETSPVAKWVDITNGNYTAMENPIYMMIVDDPSSGQIISAKKTVMVVAGIQGRDHHAVAAAMYVLYQLIERSEAHADLLTKYRFWIIPIFNPDGYDYSMTFPHKWDSCKGRQACESCELYGLRCTIQPCYGVNLDRNFEYQWIPPEELRAEHPCGALFAGERQLSESETRALTHFLRDRPVPIHTFIAFKEGDVLRQRASRAAAAAYSIGGRPYIAGQTSEFLRKTTVICKYITKTIYALLMRRWSWKNALYAGGIEDWVDGHLGIDNTYTVMMFRPTDSYSSKLITERVVHEAYAAMDTLLLQSADSLAQPAATLATAAASLPPTSTPTAIAALIFLAISC